MRKYGAEQLCLIWLDSFLGLEYKHKANLFELINGKTDLKSLIESSKDYVVSQIGENEYKTLLSGASKEYLDFVLESLDRRNITAICINSEQYPEFLKNVDCPPLVLYAMGKIDLLKEKNFAIVGSRKSLPISISLAKNYAEALIDGGFTLVTGIAEGIDQAVLETAVDKNANCISVIAGGFDHIYPKSNLALFEKVKNIGLVLSEYPPEIAPKPFHFPVRNRIIAGISEGVLIVSGKKKSGTVYTAEYAEEYGKALFAIPYSVGIESGEGCNELIKKGAILTDNPQDILDYFGIEQIKQANNFTEQERTIITALKDGEMHVEKLCEKLSMQIFDLTPTLSVLEIKGAVVKSGNIYGLIRNDLEA